MAETDWRPVLAHRSVRAECGTTEAEHPVDYQRGYERQVARLLRQPPDNLWLGARTRKQQVSGKLAEDLFMVLSVPVSDRVGEWFFQRCLYKSSAVGVYSLESHFR